MAIRKTHVPDDQDADDDLLRLIFTCCHPALTLETQTALALHTLCGLTVAEVGRALLVPEPTMAKRLTRARRKIAIAKIPYRTPESGNMAERLAGVLVTIYLLFNEGYNTTEGDDLIRKQLMNRSIRLSRLLHELLPEEPSTTGLLALLLLQSSRSAASLNERGEVALLRGSGPHQVGQNCNSRGHVPSRGGSASYTNRTRLVRNPGSHRSLPCAGRLLGRHQLGCRRQLVRRAPPHSRHASHSAKIRRSSSRNYTGRKSDSRSLEGIARPRDVDRFEAVRGELLHRLGRFGEAAEAYDAALALPANNSQRRFLEGRLANLRADH